MKTSFTQSFFDLSTDLFLVATYEGKVIELNPAWENILGWSLEEIRSKTFYDFIHPADRTASEKIVNQVSEGFKVLQFKNRYLHKDESWRVISWRGHVDRERGLLFGVGRDITAVEEASKLASLGEMAGGIAHEINNPLAIIYGKADQLKERIGSGKALPDEVLEGLKKIEDTTMRIAKIVRGLSTLSRHADTDPFEQVGLSDIVEETALMCEERFRNKDISCSIKNLLSEKVLCRPSQISQVLLNLLSNSCDAIETLEDKWIEIEMQDIGESVRISVTDSGKGIPAKISTRLMDPFFTTKEPGKGTGLGLSIAKAIVEDHQGRITYNPNSRHTQFVIEIPKGKPSSRLKPEPQSPDLHLH